MRLLALCIVLFCVGALSAPIDDYVHAVDNTYSWKINSTLKDPRYTAYFVELTSQTWMTIKQTNLPVWKHWLVVCVPKDNQKPDHGFIYVDGGSLHDSPPTTVDSLIGIVCTTSQTVSAHLLDIPMEPITFANDTRSRSEDSLIAYTWAHFLNHTNDPVWLARFPMTKAAVRAMDCVQELTLKVSGARVEKFVISGASKRGWVTWMTGIVDKRVIAIVPIVMPILNIVPNMNHHFQAYNGWSFALSPYLNMGNMAHLNRPEFAELAAQVDPWSYLDRLALPKYVITASGDEFFLPDSPRFFYDQLPGRKWLRTLPNAEHSLAGHANDVIVATETWYNLLINNKSLPVYDWNVTAISSNVVRINVTSDTKPSDVRLWQATTKSDTKRDFRLLVCGDKKNSSCIQPVLWVDTYLTPNEQGHYVADIQAPAKGWKGFMVELNYVINRPLGLYTLQFSTSVNVVPDVMPFPPCADHCQASTTLY